MDNSEKSETGASTRTLLEIQKKIGDINQEILSRQNNVIRPNLVNGIWVGVVKHNSVAGTAGCGGWDELEINMDCEDRNPKTGWLTTDPYLGSVSPTYSYRPGGWSVGSNATMRFCIVPGSDFHTFNLANSNAYAVLRVTTNFLPDAREVSRRFDNEDNNNGNSAFLRCGPNRTPSRNGQTINVEYNSLNNDNSVYRTYIDQNSYLSLHVFKNGQAGPGAVFMTDYPNFGMPYGVIGGENVTNALAIGLVKVDDEDNANANLYFDDESNNDQIDLWYTLKNIVEGRNGDAPSILPGYQSPHLSGKDTYVYVARVK